MQGCLPGAAPGKAHVHEAVSPPRSVGPAPGTWAPAGDQGLAPACSQRQDAWAQDSAAPCPLGAPSPHEVGERGLLW